MANFGPKPWVNLPWKNLNFSTFWTSCFYSLERRVFILEYRKTHFPALYSLKTKGGKMANFKAEPWVNPFAKIAIFSTFWTSCFYSLEGRLFVLEYRKTNFSCSIMPKKKKKIEKWPILDQTHGLTPAGEISISQLFELLVFIAYRGVFSL